MQPRNFTLLLLSGFLTLSFTFAVSLESKPSIIDEIGKFSPIDTSKGLSMALLPKNYLLSSTDQKIRNTLSYLFSQNQLKIMPLFGYIFHSTQAFAEEK